MGQVRWMRVAFASVLLVCFGLPFSPAGRTANHQPDHEIGNEVISPRSSPFLVAEYHRRIVKSDNSVENFHPSSSGGIIEQVPKEYTARYRHWKQEFLSTETGRQQWASYQNNTNFALTVVITRENPKGGNTGNYKWNEEGKLVAATITLGSRLDEGIPNPIYFPVMNSLLPSGTTRDIDGNTLAAAKIAHEFGHVKLAALVDPDLYKLQVQLVPQYNRILLTNGRNASDPRLLELAVRMGATPVEIWEDREYWGETNAMLYLRDRFDEDDFRCLLFGRIKRSIQLYAKGYEERFINIAQSLPPDRRCSW